MKKQMNVRVSEVTRRQIDEMMAALRMNEAEVVAAGIERYYAEEMPQLTIVRSVREFNAVPWMDDLETNIVGLEGRAVEDANDWISDGNGDGRMYPYQLRIYRDLSPVKFPWYVVDETGWSGHEEEPAQLVSRHASYEAAKNQRTRMMKAQGME